MQRNFQPLTSRVTNSDIALVRRQYAETILSSINWRYSGPIFLILTYVVFTVLGDVGTPSWNQALIQSGVGVALTIVIWVVYKKVQQKRWTQNVRLRRFAEANSLTFEPTAADPLFAGMIFNIGYGHKVTNQLRNLIGKPFEIANYRYTIGYGKSQKDVDYGYIMIKLDRNLPHIVLDSLANNKRLFGMTIASSLPISFDKDQKLSLEGDFDAHFTLYAPLEYKPDALYVFTPDLMALFVDESGTYDAEIVDDRLYIYSTEPFDLANPAVMQRIFNIIETVGAKAIQQTDNYADNQIRNRTADIVANSGRRLKSRPEWLIPAMILIVYGLLSILPGLVQFFMKLSQ